MEFFNPIGVQQLRRSFSQKREARNSDFLSGDALNFNLEKVLHWVVQKREEHDVKARELGVDFTNLCVVGLGAQASYQPTLGSYLNPMTLVDELRRYLHPPVRDTLNGFEGVVKLEK